MEHRKKRPQLTVDSKKFGASFSLKQCRNFGLDPNDTLRFLVDMGFRRFRLMSYWDEHEVAQGNYDFTSLDKQFDLIEKSNGIVSLCLGARQPRWPESHWPKWALELPATQKNEALYKFIEQVISRYRNRPILVSYQLENEALNRSFGKNGDFNRQRLRQEFQLVRDLDSSKPIIMTTSNTWGLPLRRPQPDMFGITLYTIQHEADDYRISKIPSWWYPLRVRMIRLTTGKPSFIHELQAEPWGPKAIWEMSSLEQSKSMDTERLKLNIEQAKRTKLYPVDLWGGEWWYWRLKKHDDQSIAEIIKTHLTSRI